MRQILFIGLPLMMIILFISASKMYINKPSQFHQFQKSGIISCGFESSDISADESGKFIPLMSGMGKHHYTVSTKNDSAQIYFNQGLNFYYSYHLKEAIASFKEASRFDIECPMAYWGQALAMGPYYNSPTYEMNKDVPGIIKQMMSKKENCSDKERDLLDAMKERYSSDFTNSDRVKLDDNYAVALSGLVKKYPHDNDIKALYIDSRMLEHKWDFWNTHAQPRPWTNELVAICKGILSNDSIMPAALHYYIHLTEASKQPLLALHTADLLKVTMPGVGHMVHMSSHEYQLNGLFDEGVRVNEIANSLYNKHDSMAPWLGFGQNSSAHVFIVQSFCAMNAGMYSKGMPLYLRAKNRAKAFENSMDKEPGWQLIYMTPVIAYVRLGKWEQILSEPSPDKRWKYAGVLDNFAKGMAYVRKNQLTKAESCKKVIADALNDSILQVAQVPFNKPVSSCKIALSILNAEILLSKHEYSASIAAFKNAVVEEDQLVYREPPDWFLPARQYLGAALLKMNKAKEASLVYREDLKLSPSNGWSLLGMSKSLGSQNKNKEAEIFKLKSKQAFKNADVFPDNSVF